MAKQAAQLSLTTHVICAQASPCFCLARNQLWPSDLIAHRPGVKPVTALIESPRQHQESNTFHRGHFGIFTSILLALTIAC